MNRPRRDERGSGTVYALGVIAVLLAAAVGIAGLIQAQSATGRARAAANGASVSACSVAGEDVTVSVTVPATILGLPRQAAAQARAGPVDAPPEP